MSDDVEAIVEERLAVFEDEPDLNDWFEVMCGAAMAVLGIFHLVSPGNIVDPDVMRWFASAVIAAGAIWAGHGLKDISWALEKFAKPKIVKVNAAAAAKALGLK